LPPVSRTLGLTAAVPNAEPFVASLLGFFLQQACLPCVKQLCYIRKAFLGLERQVSGSDSSSILLLLLFHPAAPRRVSHSQLTVGAVAGSGGGQHTICSDISEMASLQSVAVSARGSLRGREGGGCPFAGHV